MKEIIIKGSVISEKSVSSVNASRYVVQVEKFANKPEVKKQLEKLFKVKVIKINSINYPAKARTFRRIKGQIPGEKRMIVTLSKGQKKICAVNYF